MHLLSILTSGVLVTINSNRISISVSVSCLCSLFLRDAISLQSKFHEIRAFSFKDLTNRVICSQKHSWQYHSQAITLASTSVESGTVRQEYPHLCWNFLKHGKNKEKTWCFQSFILVQLFDAFHLVPKYNCFQLHQSKCAFWCFLGSFNDFHTMLHSRTATASFYLKKISNWCWNIYSWYALLIDWPLQCPLSYLQQNQDSSSSHTAQYYWHNVVDNCYPYDIVLHLCVAVNQSINPPENSSYIISTVWAELVGEV